MENNFKFETQKLCDMQMELWKDVKNDLMAMDNPADEEIRAIFHKHLRETHHDAILQLIEVKLKIDEIEMMLEETTN